MRGGGGGGEVWGGIKEGVLKGKEEGDERVRYVGGDIVRNNVRITRGALRRYGGGRGNNVSLTEGDVRDMRVGGGEGREEVKICITNPPWGGNIRESSGQEVEEAWDGLGVFCKRELRGGEAWIIAPKSTLTGLVRMKEKRKIGWKIGDGGKVFIRQYLINE